MWEAGSDQVEDGVVLHQPLNLPIFRKNTDFGRKMNGPPVCPAPKTENAPTWRSGSPLFWTPFLALFAPLFVSPTHPAHHTRLSEYKFIINVYLFNIIYLFIY